MVKWIWEPLKLHCGPLYANSDPLHLKVWLILETEHITPLLRKLHWLPVVPRTQYKVATLCYNSFTESYPVYLSELLTVHHPSRQLHSTPFLTSEPSAYLSQKQRPLDNELFLSQAWHSVQNSLYDIHHSVSTSSFKQALKTHLFKSAYN